MSKYNVVISMDSHHEAFLDLSSYVPSRYRAEYKDAFDRGMRNWRRALAYVSEMIFSGHDFLIDSMGGTDSAAELHALDWQNYNRQLSIGQRLAILDEDGVAGEMLVDSFGPNSLNPQLQHEMTLAYSRWFKDYVAPAPHRFTAAVVTSLLCDVPTIVQEIDYAFARGIKAIHLAPCPSAVSMDLPHYNHARYEPIWAALNERSMSIVFHSSPGREKPLWTWSGEQRGWEALEFMDMESSHQSTLKYFLLAGIPERYPNIHIGYIESGIAWVPPLLKRLDSVAKGPRYNPEHKLEMLPSEQWRRQCYCSGPLGASDFSMRDEVGVSSLMFGTDFMHTEGTTPNTRAHLRKSMSEVLPKDRFEIVAGNAARAFGFDLNLLAMTPPAQQQLFIDM